MKKYLVATFFVVLALFGVGMFFGPVSKNSGAPPYMVEDLKPPENIDPYDWIRNWKRPEGPPKVGLQVGHWKNHELPDELDRLKGSTGSSGGGKSEWEVNYAIAQKTKSLLEAHGITVELLPATIPPGFWADVFVSIHADGSDDPLSSGFKAATPRRDFSNTAGVLLSFLEEEYKKQTSLELDPNVSRNMKGYYAFAWWRYTHAIHPRTPAVILETGFLTSPYDRTVIVDQPGIAAQGISNGIIIFLRKENLL